MEHAKKFKKISKEEKELIKKAKAAYHKQWVEKNKDNVEASLNKYWLKKAKQMGLK